MKIPRMTRGQFAVIAEALLRSKPTPRAPEAKVAQWRATVVRVAAALSGMNARFDMERFLEACGYKDALRDKVAREAP